jgi:pyruvate,orthophosphate dikinase
MTASLRPTDSNLLHVIGESSTREVGVEAVGAKAFNLMRMSEAGLPVPPGFALATELCRDYHEAGRSLSKQSAELVAEGVRSLEQATGRQFGGPRRPLLIAVRSGAAVSMPGMLETILNVGLSDDTLPGLLRYTGDPVFVWDSYRRLIQSYAEVVEGCPPAPFARAIEDAAAREGAPSAGELDVEALSRVVRNMQDVYRQAAGHPFPQDPMEQLMGAVEAVLRSWNGRRAAEYRAIQGLTDLTGTAVTVQAMVFGNMGVTSGSGVGFTRDPATGEDRLYVDFLLNAQGEDVVGGRQAADDPDDLIGAFQGLAHELQVVRRRLEAIFQDAQDFEFTVEEGKLWLLQTRAAKRTPLAALRIACHLVDEELIDTRTALERLHEYDLDSIGWIRLADEAGAAAVAQGTPAGSGVARGRVALSVDTARRHAEAGEPVVLVREEASTDDISALAVCRALVTATGARTSHAAVVARQLGVVCVVGCSDLSVDLDRRRARMGVHELGDDSHITVDGGTGCVYPGELEVRFERPSELISRVREWQATPTSTPSS